MTTPEQMEALFQTLYLMEDTYNIQHNLLNECHYNPPEWWVVLWRSYEQTPLLLDRLHTHPLDSLPAFLFEDIIALCNRGCLTDKKLKSIVRLFFVHIEDIFNNQWQEYVPEMVWLSLLELDVSIIESMKRHRVSITPAMKKQYAESLKDFQLCEYSISDSIFGVNDPYFTLRAYQTPHLLNSDEKNIFLEDSQDIWNQYLDNVSSTTIKPAWQSYFLWIAQQPFDFPLIETGWLEQGASLRYHQEQWQISWNEDVIEDGIYLKRLLYQLTLSQYRQFIQKIPDMALWYKHYPEFLHISNHMIDLFPHQKVVNMIDDLSATHAECFLHLS